MPAIAPSQFHLLSPEGISFALFIVVAPKGVLFHWGLLIRQQHMVMEWCGGEGWVLLLSDCLRVKPSWLTCESDGV